MSAQMPTLFFGNLMLSGFQKCIGSLLSKNFERKYIVNLTILQPWTLSVALTGHTGMAVGGHLPCMPSSSSLAAVAASAAGWIVPLLVAGGAKLQQICLKDRTKVLLRF